MVTSEGFPGGVSFSSEFDENIGIGDTKKCMTAITTIASIIMNNNTNMKPTSGDFDCGSCGMECRNIGLHFKTDGKKRSVPFNLKKKEMQIH